MSGLSATGTAARWCPARRYAAALVTAALLAPALAGCGGAREGVSGAGGTGWAVARADRSELARGSAVTWGIDRLPDTFNAFRYDAGPVTDQVAAAVLPTLFTLDEHGRPQLNEEYLVSAEITAREPRQTVRYTLHPDAAWSDGEPLSAADFEAQWEALGGQDSAYWSARNVGYDRVEKVGPGPAPHQVDVTFTKPYADWKSLFTPLYPRSVTGQARSFNDGSRTGLPATAGPFALDEVDREEGTIRLVRSKEWWGTPALLDELVFTEVPFDQRRDALTSGRLDVVEVGPGEAGRIRSAAERRPGAAAPDGATSLVSSRQEIAEAMQRWARARLELESARDTGRDSARKERARTRAAALAARAAEHHAETVAAAERLRHRTFAAREEEVRKRLRGYTVHRAYAPAYTQLAMNGRSEVLSDERVRWAIARALDREKLAEAVHAPAGLPVRPLGSHLRMPAQHGYRDTSGALGDTGPKAAAQDLEAAGWQGRPEESAGAAYRLREAASGTPEAAARFTAAPPAARLRAALLGQAAKAQSAAAREGGREAPRLERAARDTARAAKEAARWSRLLSERLAAPVRTRQDEQLRLRFVVPAGAGGEELRATGRRIAEMLAGVGVRAELTEVDGEEFFAEHITSGDFDLALYSWPATAYPATDARPLFAKPRAIAGGELIVEQNYTRVGTDHIDQLLDQAAGELDEKEHAKLLDRADARIWAVAGSVPLYQRPQLVAARSDLAGVGAHGLATPRYQDIGYRK